MVTLPCKYEVSTYGISNVCWGRDQSWFNCEHTLLATDGMMVNYRASNRYSLPSKLQHGDVSLTIKAAQKADTGFYVCRIEIPGPFNDLCYSFYLIIINGEYTPNNILWTTIIKIIVLRELKSIFNFTAPYPFYILQMKCHRISSQSDNPFGLPIFFSFLFFHFQRTKHSQHHKTVSDFCREANKRSVSKSLSALHINKQILTVSLTDVMVRYPSKKG